MKYPKPSMAKSIAVVDHDHTAAFVPITNDHIMFSASCVCLRSVLGSASSDYDGHPR